MCAKGFRFNLRPKSHEVAVHMHGMDVVGHPLINEEYSYLLLTLGSYK